jgi:hypothetical protein
MEYLDKRYIEAFDPKITNLRRTWDNPNKSYS